MNVGCGKVLKKDGEDGIDVWINSDLRKLEGVNKVFNSFIVPWPLEDKTFDRIYMSHLVEHIPHVVRAYNRVTLQAEPIWDEDGFFVFFRECHRILKDGGTIELIGPYHRSTGADQDPTHTRYITESTFSYLWEWSETFDYELGYKFNQTEFNIYGKSEVDGEIVHSLWNTFHSFRTVLVKS